MKKYIKGLYLALVLLFLFGCNSTSTGSINCLILDASTNEAISGVKVSFAGGKTVKTDSQGKMSIKGLGAGNYNLVFEKKGYAKMLYQSNLSFLAERENLAVENKSLICYLYKSNKTVYGTVNRNNIYNKIEIVNDADLQIKFSLPNSNSLFLDIFSVTTDANGKYTFQNCPENVYFEIFPKDIYRDNKKMTAASKKGLVGTENKVDDIIYY